MRLIPFLFVFLSASISAAPQAPSAGPNFSGTYDCKGVDGHEGPYTSTVTLDIVKEHSSGSLGAYLFKMEVPGYGTYPGHAATNGLNGAIHFALTDPAPKDYGTGIARFSKDKRGKWRFSKYYFEPEFKGGNHGTETCVQR